MTKEMSNEALDTLILECQNILHTKSIGYTFLIDGWTHIYLGDDDNNNPQIMPFESRTIPVYAKLGKYYMSYEHGEPSEKSREWFWKEVFRGLTELDKSNITESTMTICPIVTLSK